MPRLMASFLIFRPGEFREGVTKASSINKIGHGLHALDPIYRKFTLENPRLKTLARELGQHKDPRVLQSMVICKQPKVSSFLLSFEIQLERENSAHDDSLLCPPLQIGGEVPIHNDSTFLYTDPVSAVGFWFALEPCTKTVRAHIDVERMHARTPLTLPSTPTPLFLSRFTLIAQNGCLWFVPGSHKTVPIRKRCASLQCRPARPLFPSAHLFIFSHSRAISRRLWDDFRGSGCARRVRVVDRL